MSDTKRNIVDVGIIGAGPAGLFAAFYAGMRGMTSFIVESLPQVGGQLAALYPEKYIYDVGGFPQIRAKELVANLERQAMRFEPDIFLEETVEDLFRDEDGIFHLKTQKDEHQCRAVIIAAGVGSFQPKRIPLPEAERFEDRGIVYAVPNPATLTGQNVVVLGGGDSAVDWALMAKPVAKSVTLVHRRNQFRAHEESLKQVHESGIQIKTPYEAVELRGGDRLEEIVIQNKETGESETLPAETVVVSFGFQSSLGPMAEWGIEMDNREIKVDPTTMATSIPGVFAIGDCATYHGKLQLIAMGFGEAPVAVTQAKHFIDPSQKIHTVHSSNLKF